MFQTGYTPWNKGKTLSEDVKQRRREAHVGFQPGYTPWNKGMTMSKEYCNSLSIAHMGKYVSEEHRSNLRKAMLGRTFTDETIRKMSIAKRGKRSGMKGHKHTVEAIEIMCVKHRGQVSSMRGKKHTDEAKEKMRLANLGRRHTPETRLLLRRQALDRVLINGCMTSIGRHERQLLDAHEVVTGMRLLRQYPLRELGYIVDGYCVDSNTVVEVYEKDHDKRVYKDLDRETEICNFLGCDFNIIWDTMR